MRRAITTGAAASTAILLSATVAFAGVSDVAKGHGKAVSEVAKAADFVSGRAHGEAVSTLAKQHGAEVSAAARAQAAANKAGKGKGNGKGAEKSAEGKAKGANAGEPGRIKSESGDD